MNEKLLALQNGGPVRVFVAAWTAVGGSVRGGPTLTADVRFSFNFNIFR